MKGLCLSDLSKLFEVECDALGVGINGMLSQESPLVSFFNGKLNDAKCKQSMYNKEFYMKVQTLKH